MATSVIYNFTDRNTQVNQLSITGDVSNIVGDVTFNTGDVSNLTGDISHLGIKFKKLVKAITSMVLKITDPDIKCDMSVSVNMKFNNTNNTLVLTNC